MESCLNGCHTSSKEQTERNNEIGAIRAVELLCKGPGEDFAVQYLRDLAVPYIGTESTGETLGLMLYNFGHDNYPANVR